MTRLSLEAAEQKVADLFIAAGASPANAASVALALVMAEADGLKGHGLSRVPTYLAMLRSGKIDGQAVPIARQPRPGVLAIDAAHGFAYPAIDLAVIELPEIARKQGIAAAPIRRSNHCGAAGLHVERLAEQGLVAMLFANTPGAMAPWGGAKPVFGTNPIAFAAPLAGRDPLVIDMALSKVARGPIVAAKQKGEPIPEGWALDAGGRPTTDPAAAIAGTMVPLGDAKGATLAMMVEILAAALVGTHFAFQASAARHRTAHPRHRSGEHGRQLVRRAHEAADSRDRGAAGNAFARHAAVCSAGQGASGRTRGQSLRSRGALKRSRIGQRRRPLCR
jgi:(2R)-3-sulfolactate dehydrogenase (NADP+)